jgi:hypothetical protein
MSQRDAYRRESPGPIDHGFFLNLEWHADESQIQSVMETWRRRADECTNEVARAEWMQRIAQLREFLADKGGQVVATSGNAARGGFHHPSLSVDPDSIDVGAVLESRPNLTALVYAWHAKADASTGETRAAWLTVIAELRARVAEWGMTLPTPS